MYFLSYSSYATIDFDEETLKSLLIKARERNKSLGITGMLFYFDGKFIQLIEGEESQVKLLYQHICDDPRHDRVVTMKEGPITERHYPNWTMGFKAITDDELENEESFRNLQTPNGLNFPAILNLLKIISDKK